MASLNSFADALREAADKASLDTSVERRQTLEELFSRGLRDALDRINSGTADSYDLGLWAISNLILLADHEGYDLSETAAFLREMLD